MRNSTAWCSCTVHVIPRIRLHVDDYQFVPLRMYILFVRLRVSLSPCVTVCLHMLEPDGMCINQHVSVYLGTCTHV